MPAVPATILMSGNTMGTNKCGHVNEQTNKRMNALNLLVI